MTTDKHALTNAPLSADTAVESPFPPALLARIRERFHYVDHCPYAGRRIFFENAGGSLTLRSVVEHSASVAGIPDNEHRDNAASRALTAIVEQGRADLASFFGATGGVIFGGETGTECLFRLIRTAALATPDGGSVVASTLEHPATYDATAVWAERTGRERVEIPFDTATGMVTAEDYARHVRPDTRMATVIHTSPVTGMRMDLAEIAAAIRRIAPECWIIVDGIQHAPHGSLSVDTYGVDGYVVSLYKAYSKFNNGYAWVSERMSVLPHDRLRGKPEQAWELGSRDPAALAAASEVVDYLDWLGGQFTESDDRRSRLLAAGEAMQAQERYLMHHLLHGAEGLPGLCDYANVRVIADPDSPARESVVSFAVEGMDAKRIVAAFGERGIRIHARSNDVFSGNILRPLQLESVARVSLAHYNTVDEVTSFLRAWRDIQST
ncbi:aminotransferase class V-fold PLP-dependent enzyme [Arhodomonas sp. AD133]|uniref:aminotransferase class V-fold PLP-dependent enzyme n=1 Tax=Arhodomonas sp. AD133 TaxID=3415009 RepID=UPI003EB8C5AE